MTIKSFLGDLQNAASGAGVTASELLRFDYPHQMVTALGKAHDLMIGTSWPQKVGKGALAFAYELIDPNAKTKFFLKALKLVVSYPGIVGADSGPIRFFRGLQL